MKNHYRERITRFLVAEAGKLDRLQRQSGILFGLFDNRVRQAKT